MKRGLGGIIVVLFALVLAAPQAFAADAWHQFSAKQAQSSQLGKDKLNPDIKLFMKGEGHAKIIKSYGEFKTNQRSNGFGKSAEVACEKAFISALIALQGRAVKEGGNAVVDIYTITKDKVFESAEEYSCIKGGFVTNVALKGTVVTLAE
ncbi:MAG TPA: hypothetical protein VIR78_10925 [Malonomonas sp.]